MKIMPSNSINSAMVSPVFYVSGLHFTCLGNTASSWVSRFPAITTFDIHHDSRVSWFPVTRNRYESPLRTLSRMRWMFEIIRIPLTRQGNSESNIMVIRSILLERGRGQSRTSPRKILYSRFKCRHDAYACIYRESRWSLNSKSGVKIKKSTGENWWILILTLY